MKLVVFLSFFFLSHCSSPSQERANTTASPQNHTNLTSFRTLNSIQQVFSQQGVYFKMSDASTLQISFNSSLNLVGEGTSLQYNNASDTFTLKTEQNDEFLSFESLFVNTSSLIAGKNGDLKTFAANSNCNILRFVTKKYSTQKASLCFQPQTSSILYTHEGEPEFKVLTTLNSTPVVNPSNPVVNPDPDRDIRAVKPVMYFYTEKNRTLPVKVKLHLPEDFSLSYTYPKPVALLAPSSFEWDISVKGDQGLYWKNRFFRYLFWEAKAKEANSPFAFSSKAEQVQGKNIEEYFEKKLTEFGLNWSEISDFITYWAPQLSVNKVNLIEFINEQYDNLFPVELNVSNVHKIRIFMIFKKTPDFQANFPIYKSNPDIEFFDIKRNEQEFYFVEWGGADMLEPQTVH